LVQGPLRVGEAGVEVERVEDRRRERVERQRVEQVGLGGRGAIGRNVVGRNVVGRNVVGRNAVGRNAVGRNVVGRFVGWLVVGRWWLVEQRRRCESAVTAQVIDGKAIAAKLRGEVAAAALELRANAIAPTLAVVLVGDDPASAVYVKNKTKAAREANVDVRDHKLPSTTTQAELMALVESLNRDPVVDGILVQLPLPAHLDADAVIRAIDPAKDVDGLHPLNLGLLAQGRPAFAPCTPKGCMRLLGEVGAELAGARAVVIGRSVLVGKPIALLLANANATVTMCHSKTRDLADEVRRADVVVAAIGKPEMVRGDWIKAGAYVLDVGINRLDSGKLVGDVEYASAAERARAITPVPGGVGPMTIACLLENTVEAARRRRSK